MNDFDELVGRFHDVTTGVTTFYKMKTGETITRELTPEEVAALPEPTEPLA